MRFQTLAEWLNWQESLHSQAIDLGLDRVRQVWQSLQIASLARHVVTVAGTNGKGSCISFLESFYQQAGFSTASYTSPHLLRYNERVCINQQPVSDEALCQAFDRVDQARGNVSLTYFEFGTLAAFAIIAQADVDVCFLEVGLGGRLDAVNIIDADVAVITSVGLDHTDWLGDTREQIGFEKAGVFRTQRTAIVTEPDCPETVKEYAQEIQASLLCIDRDFSIRLQDNAWDWIASNDNSGRSRYSLPLPGLRGEHQLRNAAAAIAVVNQLQSDLPVSMDAIRAGLLEARRPGRFQECGGDVSIILDVAHNVQAVEALIKNLQRYPVAGKICAIFAAMKDKDIPSILRLFDVQCAGLVTHWFLPDIALDRAENPEKIASFFEAPKLHNSVTICSNVKNAYEKVQDITSPGDRILIFGSFYLVEQVLELTHFRCG
jgi:dihydrofolate synthase/folylpolyglutamate synthase